MGRCAFPTTLKSRDEDAENEQEEGEEEEEEAGGRLVPVSTYGGSSSQGLDCQLVPCVSNNKPVREQTTIDEYDRDQTTLHLRLQWLNFPPMT